MPQLLTNASTTGPAVQWPGGRGAFNAVGTFGGATVALQYLGPNSTWLPVGSPLSANGLQNFALPPGQIRAAVAGGAPSGLYAAAEQSKG